MDRKTFLMVQLTPSSLEDKKDLEQPTLPRRRLVQSGCSPHSLLSMMVCVRFNEAAAV